MMLRESAADSRIVSLALGLGSRRHLLLGTTLIGLPDQVPTEQSPQRRTGSAHQCHQPGTLSDCVRRLEKELGVRLLNRTTRGLTPTEIGARLLERLRPALDEINTALNDLQEDPQNPAGSLRLHVPGVIARHILPQLLDDFLARYPASRPRGPPGQLVAGSADRCSLRQSRHSLHLRGVHRGAPRQRPVATLHAGLVATLRRAVPVLPQQASRTGAAASLRRLREGPERRRPSISKPEIERRPIPKQSAGRL